VRLDLVNRVQLQGSAVGEYFGQYGIRHGWRAWAGIVEGQPAVLMQQQGRADDTPDYFVVLGLTGERISSIRDFFFARYALPDAAHRSLSAD
jgi:RNA polymerase sigma-70 factor (ECF subfamily)